MSGPCFGYFATVTEKPCCSTIVGDSGCDKFAVARRESCNVSRGCGRASEGVRGEESARKAKRRTEVERTIGGKLSAVVRVR
jgi:hypothetical protein